MFKKHMLNYLIAGLLWVAVLLIAWWADGKAALLPNDLIWLIGFGGVLYHDDLDEQRVCLYILAVSMAFFIWSPWLIARAIAVAIGVYVFSRLRMND